MLRSRTITEQILPVLRAIRRNAARGVPIVQACQISIRAQAEVTGKRYQTIGDGLRRRLGLSDISAFHRLVEKWLGQGSAELRNLLLSSTEAAAHESIEDFFKKTEDQTYPPPSGAARTAGLSDPFPGRQARAGSITIDGLDPDVIAALVDRAAHNRRTLDEEIKTILTRAARADRDELARWSAQMRARLRGHYQGDVTAEIQADRQR